MGCGASRTWENVEAAADLDHSPTIWVGNIPSGFGHINSLGLAVVRPLAQAELEAGERTSHTEPGTRASALASKSLSLPRVSLRSVQRVR